MTMTILQDTVTASAAGTRKSIRRSLSEWLSREWYKVGDVKASPQPQAGALAFNEFVDEGDRASGTGWAGRFLYWPVEEQERVISKVTPASGLARLVRPFESIPDVGEEMEVHRFSVMNVIHPAINDALSRMRREVWAEVSASSSSNRYSLGAYTDLVRLQDVIGVYLRGSDSSIITKYPSDIQLETDYASGTRYLFLPGIPAGSTVVLHLKLRYPDLDDDSTVSLAPEDWLMAGSRLQVFKRLVEAGAATRDRSSYEAGMARAIRDFRNLSLKYQPRRAKRIQVPEPWADVDYP